MRQILEKTGIREQLPDNIDRKEKMSLTPSKRFKIIKSPMNGYFFISRDVTSELNLGSPLVSVGDTIKEGQVICCLAAMELLFEIEARFGGVIIEVMVKDAQRVEYDQPLFRVRQQGQNEYRLFRPQTCGGAGEAGFDRPKADGER